MSFEAPGVEPVFLEKRQAIDYAEKPRQLSLRRECLNLFAELIRQLPAT